MVGIATIVIRKFMKKSDFKDRFKVGDIIRRGGYIRSGQLMIVESFDSSRGYFDDREAYTCQDLFRDGQKWGAYEEDDFTLATDDDIIYEIASRMTTMIDVDTYFGKLELDINDTMIYVSIDDGTIMLDPKSAIKLRDIINQYVEES
jgi:hypothetical protein